MSAPLYIVVMLGGPSAEREVSDRKSTRLNSSHLVISYAVFCLKKKQHLRVADQTRSPRRQDLRRLASLKHSFPDHRSAQRCGRCHDRAQESVALAAAHIRTTTR